MNCEQARQKVVAGSGLLQGWQARQHVRGCADCTDWFADIRQMAALLGTVAPHQPPDNFLLKMRDTVVRSARPMQAEHREGGNMRRLVFSALCMLIVVGVALWIFMVRDTLALADLKQALLHVQTVHMTGTEDGVRKDKWIRREPFAAFEDNTPTDPAIKNHYIFAANSELTYWYLPERGNRVVISNALKSGFMDDIIAPLEQSGSSATDVKFRVVGHTEIDGKRVMLIKQSADKSNEIQMEYAVDEDTKLTRRLCMFRTGQDGKTEQTAELYFEYNKTAPSGVFEWKPPSGATVVDKRHQ
jgi:hypothetical protein